MFKFYRVRFRAYTIIIDSLINVTDLFVCGQTTKLIDFNLKCCKFKVLKIQNSLINNNKKDYNTQGTLELPW